MPKKSMDSVKMVLTDAQLRKLAKGQGVRVCPVADMEGKTAYDVWCGSAKCKRINRQFMKGKGVSLKLDPEEMDANEIEVEAGGRINWKKLGRTLRSTAKSVGKFYREKVRPVVGPTIRKAVKTAIEKGIPLAVDALATVTGQPEMAAASQQTVERLAKKAAESGTEKLSKLTGAFGVKQQIAKMENPAPLPYRAQLQNNYSPFLNPNHPAMNPALPMPDNSLPIIGRGLFMHGKGMFMSSGMGMVGLPMDPSMAPGDNSMMR